MDKRRVVLYGALLILPLALAVTGFVFLAAGIHDLGLTGNLQSVLAPVLGGSCLLVIAIATATVVIRNERKQYREMMSGSIREEKSE